MAAEEYEIRNIILNRAIAHIDEKLPDADNKLLRKIKNKYALKYKRIQKTDLPANYFENRKMESPGDNVFNQYSQLEVELLNVEHASLVQLQKNGTVSEEVFRKIERELDLEETRIKLEMHL